MTVLFLALCFTVYLFADKCSNEGSLKERLGQCEQALFKVKNENLIIKREAEEALAKGGGTQIVYQETESESSKHLQDENKKLKVIKL